MLSVNYHLFKQHTSKLSFPRKRESIFSFHLDFHLRGNDGIELCRLNLKQKFIALQAALLLACSLPAFAAEITYFYDGDTVNINDAGYEYKLRITDIDAPEKIKVTAKNHAVR